MWKDWWCGDCSPATKFPGYHVNSGTKVCDLLGDNQSWNLNSISHIIDADTCDIIRNISIPVFELNADQPSWPHAIDGLFSTSSVYEFIRKENDDLKG